MKSNINILKTKLKTLHYIYIIHCLLTGEFYFGKHSTNNKNDGYRGGGSELNRRIKELGSEHFVITLFARFESENEAYDLEEDLIRHFISDIKCLNKIIGGRNGKCDYATYKYPSGKIAKLHINDPDVLSGKAVHVNKGKIHSEETKNKISKAKIGKPLSKEHKQKLRKSKKPRTKPNKPRQPHSESTRLAISKGKGFDLSSFSNEEITFIKNLRSEKVATRKISTILFETFNRKLSHETIRKYF